MLESSVLTKPDEMIMYKVVLYSVQFVDIIYNSLFLPTKFRTKSLVQGCVVSDDVVYYNERLLLSDVFGEQGYRTGPHVCLTCGCVVNSPHIPHVW
jgi:hypothetical protein